MIKDKRKLKNYLCCNYNELQKNCYLMFNDYVISDTYSIVCLNDNNELNVIRRQDKNNYFDKLEKFREKFKYNSKRFKEFIPNYEDEYYKIDEKFNVDLKKVKEIKNLIKADKFFIKQLEDNSTKYIIEIFNSKTLEQGFLLPCRDFS